MENYSCVKHESTAEKEKNCIKIQTGSKMKMVIEKGEQYLEKNGNLKLVASGKAINKLVSVAEIIKRKSVLYQYNHLSSYVVTDTWEAQSPLDLIKVEQHNPVFTIILSKERILEMADYTEQLAENL
eukprot:NODE_469_length_7049_cov_0.468489.p8 type:complete len:127 gc:universal NODE_469_length_7049_cov_0.468489:2370-2750(+)